MHLRACCQYMSAKVAGLLKVRSVIRHCEKKRRLRNRAVVSACLSQVYNKRHTFLVLMHFEVQISPHLLQSLLIMASLRVNLLAPEMQRQVERAEI